MSNGKGVILYELIKNDKDFFDINKFYSSLKNKILSQEDYESVKKFYKKLHMKKISDLNYFYNFQYTIILCETFQSCAQMMIEKYGFSLRKCLLASTLSGWIHRKMSKVMPTNTENVEVSEKILIGGFSCVNTCFAFDSNILLPKNKGRTRNGKVKILYKIKNERTNVYEDKRIVTRILKMDESTARQ